MVDWLMNGLVSWLAARVLDLLGGLLTFLTSTIFTSPDVTILPQVKAIADKSALVVNASFILAIIAVGVATMVGDTVQMRYGVKELVPRLVVGFVLSAFAVPLTSVLIEVANALTGAMTGTSAPTTETLTFVKTRLAAAMSDQTNGLLLAIVGLLIVALMFVLVFSWLTRVGVLVILAGLAPLALAGYATPWTQGVADMWWRTLLGCLATPTLQAVSFVTGIHLLIDPRSNLPILLGLPGSDVANLILVIVVLWTTIKIPGLMSLFVTHKGPSIGGIVLRAVVMQGLVRRIPFLRGGR
ncbi:MAG: hypothetical protein QOH97_2038 [Actinoplanes sp.]|jgi:hypothetical protein|nr:hypothetical protein [Actinoplanes sp.]